MDLNLVKQINDSPFKAFFAIAGGGQSFIGDYTSISGASNTVVGAIIPYHQSVFERFITGRVDRFASQEGARKLAVASYYECLKAGIAPEFSIGIGASSSVVKDGEREGRQHRIIVAYHKQYETRCDEYILRQGRTRKHEDEFAALVIFNMLAAASVGYVSEKMPITQHEVYHSTEVMCADDWKPLTTKVLTMVPSNVRNDDKPLVVFCGSWNPIHDGHWQVIRAAEKILGAPVNLELTVNNTDKGTIDFIELQRRNQMVGCSTLPYFLSNCARYVDKIAALKHQYPNRELIFVVGMDTWNRIWDEKYGISIRSLNTLFSHFNIKFLVFGRKGYDCKHIHGLEFRIKSEEAAKMQLDFSSTAIRKEQNARKPD